MTSTTGVSIPMYPCDRGNATLLDRGYHDFTGEGVCRLCGQPSRWAEKTPPMPAPDRTSLDAVLGRLQKMADFHWEWLDGRPLTSGNSEAATERAMHRNALAVVDGLISNYSQSET